jgi:hypothetical protein
VAFCCHFFTVNDTQLVVNETVHVSLLQILLILNSFKSQLGSFLYPLIVQYISGCTAGDEFKSAYRSVVSALAAVVVFASIIREAAAEQIVRVCGQDKAVILGATGFIITALKQYIELLLGLRIIFNCGIWSPIYTSVTHDGKLRNWDAMRLCFA